ncbi:hypothetical protein Tco_0201190 [Tanacetum coccineum]
MTTPRTPVMSLIRIFIPFIILSNSEDEVTTLLVRSAPLSPDYVSASPDYSPYSNSDSEPIENYSPDEHLTETALTPFVQLPPTRPLPTSSAIRSRSPSPPPVAALSPPLLAAVSPPPPERIESLNDDQDEVTRDSLRITIGRITRLQLRAVAAEQQIGDRVRIQKAEMTGQDVEALHARAEAAEQADRLEMAEL